MAKTMRITDPKSGMTYNLEFTRKTTELMERQGFRLDELQSRPMTMLPTLFAGAFLAHHRLVKRENIDSLFARMARKDELVQKLVEMYNEPLTTLMEDPDEDDQGNADWGTDF